jgi:hypothetical protein
MKIMPMNVRLLNLFLLATLLLASCTSRTREIIKEQYVISDIVASRIDDPNKKPTRSELEGFVFASRDTFETLKKKGKPLSMSVYSRAVTLSNNLKEDSSSVSDEELRQFVKMTRDAYKLMLEEK